MKAIKKLILLILLVCILLFLVQAKTASSSGFMQKAEDFFNKVTDFFTSSKGEGPLDVPLVMQYPELPRGCEVTSLAMVLQYNGKDVDKMTLADQINKVPFEQSGLRGNMHEGFVGNMYTLDKSGLGVYVEPIIELAEKYVPKRKIVNLTAKDPEDLYHAVEKGHPVWVITNARYKELTRDHFLTWNTDQGKMDVTYRQHSVVITNYDDEYVYVNDPLQKEKNRAINRQNFEAAWIQMGRQAMYIK
ncbi:C39 family peptidase [Bacillus sp. 1P06AnD]|uniref:C39 family peptidase n=1 Tax=Bacillus sp. 1P06AnD TaxID=3132208 RepID=UPI0039A3B6CE